MKRIWKYQRRICYALLALGCMYTAKYLAGAGNLLVWAGNWAWERRERIKI